MSNPTFSTVVENSREQITSGDLNRMQVLASREAANVIGYAMERDEFTDTDGSPAILRLPENPNTAAHLGIPSMSVGSFVCGVSAGQAYLWNDPTVADESGCAIVRWPASAFTINPDATQIRVDLVIATPAMVATDSQSRNILVDATARTVAPDSVNKTNNPSATISVLVGTPGSYDPPAATVGSLALWEVIVPPSASAPDSTYYTFVPRVWRRLESLGSYHGILQGCRPAWSLHIESSTSSPYIGGGTVHRAVIDGETLQVPITDAAKAIMAEPDANANPLTATIDADKDVAAYLYLCGGHWAPQNGIRGSGAVTGLSKAWCAMQMVASLTAPAYGRASADLSIAGTTVAKAGTLYIGVCFIARGTHNYKSCNIDGDWVYAATASSGGTVMAVAGFNELGVSGASGAVDIFPPSTSTMADIVIQGADTGATAAVVLYAGAAYGAADYAVARLYIPTTTLIAVSRTRVAIPSGGHFNWAGGNATPTALKVFATGYNMNVPRLG